MKCYICNADMTTFAFNRDHGDIDPCSRCLEIINDVFTDPVPEEDLRDSDVEPTPEEMMADVEALSYGRIDVV
jgi:hypothetical protein